MAEKGGKLPVAELPLSGIALELRMEGKPPEEVFPAIGTVENPAIFYDGRDLLLCYEVAPVDDGGTVILAFNDVIFFEQNPHNVPRGSATTNILSVRGTSRRFGGAAATNGGGL
jgi:hypothetical protein